MRHSWTLVCALFLSGCATLPSATVAIPQDEELSAGDKGLPISAHAPSFMPTHITGRHAGTEACPLCVYGLVPQLQIWVQEENLADGILLAESAEELCESWASLRISEHSPVVYVVMVPTAESRLSDATTKTIRNTSLKHVFFVQVPSWEDSATSRLYGHSNSDRPNVRVYSVVNRRVFQRWDSPKVNQWEAISKAVKDSAQFVSQHEVTDSQIAPTWEPGDRLEVEFRVVDARNIPLSGIKVSAMQTDAKGQYNPEGWNRREPRLSALAWTEEEGKITFRTIKPGAYPSLTEPAHIHFSAIVSGTKHFRTLWFEGDPLLSAERRSWAEKDEETLVIPLEKRGPVSKATHTFVIPD